MKQLLVPTAIIIGLIVFFVIIDRGEFYRHDNIQTVQSEKNESSQKTASEFVERQMGLEEKYTNENKPVVATAKVTEAESIRTNPIVEHTHTAKNKQTIEAPAESKLPLLSNKLPPAAVPVLTPEEAKKANQEAIRLIEKEEVESAVKLSCGQSMDFYGNIMGKHKRTLIILFVFIPVLLLSDICFIIWGKKSETTKKHLSLQRHLYILSSVSLFVFGFMFFVPWSIYLGNYSEFTFLLSDFLYEDLLGLAVIVAWTTAVFLLIPPFISNYLVALISGLGLCVYFQAMFMNCFLSEMNGLEPDWGQHRYWGIINLFIWLFVIFVPVSLNFCRRWGIKVVSAINFLFLFLEIVATGSQLLTSSDAVWERKRTCFSDGRNQFQLSKEKNIVVFVFDATGSGYYEYCFKEAPETKKQLKDFTMYPDMRALYTRTVPGLNSLLTGTPIQPARSVMDMLNDAWLSAPANSFYEQIKKAGFSPRLFVGNKGCESYLGSPDIISKHFSNFVDMDVSYDVNKKMLHSCLAQISAFSAFPYIAKKYFFYDYSAFDEIVAINIVNSNGMEGANLRTGHQFFYRKMKKMGVTTDSDSPVFAIYYTSGAHPQWFLNEKCEAQEVPYDDPLPTIKACTLALTDFIQYLKNNHIYDNTAILVCSDHESYGDVHKSPFDMSLLIKPFNQNNPELAYDYSKVQSTDILPTLLQIACGDEADYSAFEGYPVSKIPQDRKRIVYQFLHHPKVPEFYENSKTRERYKYNCLKESSFESVESFTQSPQKMFQRYIPLNKDAVVDESILSNFIK